MESPDSVLQSAGEPDSISYNPKRQDPPGFVCGICYDEPPPGEIFSLRCHHKFCKSCWRMYIEEKIKTEAQCTISCMREGCRTVITDSSISILLPTTVPRWVSILSTVWSLFRALPLIDTVNCSSSLSSRPGQISSFVPIPRVTRQSRLQSVPARSTRLPPSFLPQLATTNTRFVSGVT